MLSWCFIRLGGLFQVYKVESDHVLKIFLEKRNWESFDLAFWYNFIWKTYFLTCISKVVILFVTLGWWVRYFFFLSFWFCILKWWENYHLCEWLATLLFLYLYGIIEPHNIMPFNLLFPGSEVPPRSFNWELLIWGI